MGLTGVAVVKLRQDIKHAQPVHCFRFQSARCNKLGIAVHHAPQHRLGPLIGVLQISFIPDKPFENIL